MVFETHTIPVLVCYLARIVQRRILVNDSRRRLQRVDEEHAKEKTQQKRHELDVIEEFHLPLVDDAKTLSKIEETDAELLGNYGRAYGCDHC